MLAKIQPTSSKYKLTYPLHDSEFNVQATLFSALRQEGYIVHGEMVEHIAITNGRRAICRFDLVVYDSRHVPLVVLEVKSGAIRHKVPLPYTRQGRRYTQFGVPVWFVYGMDDVGAAMTEIRKHFPVLA